ANLRRHRSPRGWPSAWRRLPAARLGVAVAAIWGTLLAVAAPAAAFVQLQAGTGSFPSPSTVGQSGLPAAFRVVNTSNGPDAEGPLVIDTMTLVPSCSNFAQGCAGGVADPGVYQISPRGVGEGNTACAGQTF